MYAVAGEIPLLSLRIEENAKEKREVGGIEPREILAFNFIQVTHGDRDLSR